MSDDDDEVSKNLLQKNMNFPENIQPRMVHDQPYDESMDVRKL